MIHRAPDTYSEPAREVEAKQFHDYWLYMRSFVTQGKKIASLFPSSRWAAQSMIDGINFDECETVIELGAGTGAVTALLLQAARGKCRAIIVERNPVFCERLAERFPSAEIVAGDALKLTNILKRLKIRTIDHVLSTLPINWFPAQQRTAFLATICQHLQSEGSFRQLSHLPWSQRALYAQHFAAVSCPIEWRNLPPAGCYICREPRSAQNISVPSGT